MKTLDNNAQADPLQRLQAINKQLQFLHQISQEISTLKPLPQLLTDIMESSKKLMQAEASSLLLYDETVDRLHFQVATGDQGELVKKFSIDMGVGIAGWVAENRKSLLIEDCYQDPRFNPDYDRKSNFHTKSMICVPLIRKDQLLGVIQVINKTDGGIFDRDDQNLFETLAAQCAIAIENQQLTKKQIRTESLERELETARDIQQHLLPDSLPQFDDLDIAAMITPARMVGGDYHNVIRINDTETLFFIADVSGKGVPAALIVSIIVACLNSNLLIFQDGFDLMNLVTTLNRVLIECTLSTKFVTAWFGLYNHVENTLVSINAGHNPPYLLRKSSGELKTFDVGGIFLGAMDLPFQSEKTILASNDLLVYFSDGVTEAWNLEEVDYGEERLISIFTPEAAKTAAEILSTIYQDVKKYTGEAEQNDDITCGIIKKL